MTVHSTGSATCAFVLRNVRLYGRDGMNAQYPSDVEFDIRELLAHCAAGLLVDTKWVVWAEERVAAGCETPEMVELAGVVIDPGRPWQIKDVTDLVRPALESLGYDLSDPDRLVHEYALIELSRLFAGKRELWDVVGKLAELAQDFNEFGFRRFAIDLELRSDLFQHDYSHGGNLKDIEAGAWSDCETTARELHERLLATYAKAGCKAPDDFPASVYCCHKEGIGIPGTRPCAIPPPSGCA